MPQTDTENSVDETTRLLSDSSSFEYDRTAEYENTHKVRDKAVTFTEGKQTEQVTYEIFTPSGNHVVARPEGLSSGTTNTESLMHLLKGMIGTGVMGLPMAYKNGGLWMGLAVVSLMGIICTHCMHILVQSGNELSIRTKNQELDYASVMEKAFDTRNERIIRSFSNIAKNLVNAFLVITQLGICCTYIVFITDNIKQVLEQAGLMSVDSRIYVVIISALLVPYVMVKKLKTLAPFSAFANILNFVGFFLILVNLFQDLPDSTERQPVADVRTIPLFFAQALFAFEAIGMVLPIHVKMIDKPAFLGKAGVLNLGMTITIALYNAVGFYGYLKFGDDTKPSITLNLPTDEWFLLVVLTYGLSALIPHLDLLIALIGAFAGTFLAIILPAVIELLTFECSAQVWIKNGLIIGVGFVGFTTGTYTTIAEIIMTF